MTSPTATNVAPPLALTFDRVTKWYGSVCALLDVSFRVDSEVVGLVGRNGVGKSTLMKLAVGLLSPSQGQIRVGQQSAGSRAARAAVGFCPDFDRLYEPLSGVKFVAWMLRYHGFGARAAQTRAEEVLADLGLEENMRRPIREYSKGMRQRVRLGQALAHHPRFVLLDEPMTGLDPLARADLTERIRDLPRQGVGVLISSHVLHELEAVVDRVVLVHQGRLLADGRVGELREKLPERPHRLRIRGVRLRELAAELSSWREVRAVVFKDDDLEVSLSGELSFYDRLTALASERHGGIDELVPLDDDLASVFGYFVE